MTCPECSSEKVLISDAETVCAVCGFVLEEIIDDAEPQHLGNYDVNIVGGVPVRPANISIGYIYSPNERRYVNGSKDIELVSSYLALPRIVETEALRLWKRCIDSKVCGGRSIDLVLAACCYLACLTYNVTVDVDKLLACFGMEEFYSIEKTARVVNRLLNLNLILPGSTHAIIIRYGENLKMPERIIIEALEILNKKTEIVCMRKKVVVGLGIIYFLNMKHGLGLTLMEVCRLGKVSPESVRDVCSALEGMKHG